MARDVDMVASKSLEEISVIDKKERRVGSARSFEELASDEYFVSDYHHSLHASLPKAKLRAHGSALCKCAQLTAVRATVEHLVGGKRKREDVPLEAQQHRHASVGNLAPGRRRISAAALVAA